VLEHRDVALIPPVHLGCMQPPGLFVGITTQITALLTSITCMQIRVCTTQCIQYVLYLSHSLHEGVEEL
jgi:hypothetical protein